MNQALRELQTAAGATFMAIANHEVPASFGNDHAAVEAARSGVALCDRSHWGLIEVADADRLRFLHNQSTNDFMTLTPGQGCNTVFVTSTARTLDLVSAYALDDAVWLLTHPTRCQTLMEWMDRYIFFSDKVQLKNLTDTTVTLSLIGPKSDDLLHTLGAASIVGQPNASHDGVQINDVEVRIAVGSGLATPGYTLIADAEQGVLLWRSLTEAGAVPMGETVWERLRTEQGRPIPERELTEDYNPLEAGLWTAISFNKGCYIGQETIARLDTYKGVKQQLWGIRLDHTVEPGTVITVGDDKVGVLTSITPTDDGVFGLAYIRTKAGGAGLDVQVGDSKGTVVDIPFVTRDRHR
ncbi:MAG: YgfZ/GcvT domain-containing protein [Elainellaceae cyanobacterium]